MVAGYRGGDRRVWLLLDQAYANGVLMDKTDSDKLLPPTCPVGGAQVDSDPFPCHAGYPDALACSAFMGDPTLVDYLVGR